MAAAFLERLGAGRIAVRSAGSAPAERVNPVVVQAMAEIGIDLSGGGPTRLTDDLARSADVVVTMGCGDACPVVPGARREDWEVDDPAGKDLSAVRRIRDDVESRVRRLADSLLRGRA
jgi:protein-tyrosine-phosphatase